VSKVTELSSSAKFAAANAGAIPRVGLVDGALGDEQQLASIASLFPHVSFESIGPTWPQRAPAGIDVLIAGADATVASDVEAAVHRLRASPTVRIVIMLRKADVSTTRMLMREGAADVVPFPTSEAALALSLDGLFTPDADAADGPGGRVVAFLKAGGGVGATALAVQAGALLASGGADICVADLDLQFGAVSTYLDMSDAVTLSDCLSAGAGLQDMSLKAMLTSHRSGLRLVGGPRQLTPLEALGPPQVEALINALKRDFALTFLDMPTVWTAWTNRALQMADHIVIITHLSVPHLQMVDRQLQVLKAQGLDGRKLTLVINGLAPEHTEFISVKTAERALGREFAVSIPEDRKVMTAAINQGVEIAAIKRGTKLEKAIADFAHLLVPATAAMTTKPDRKRR
jgi:pilus assembly protein CpaE